MCANSSQQESGRPKEMRSIVNAFLRTGPSKLSPEPSRDYCIAAPRPNAISAEERRRRELLPSITASAVTPAGEECTPCHSAGGKSPLVSKQTAVFGRFPSQQPPASVCSNNVVDVKIESDVFSPIPGDNDVFLMPRESENAENVPAANNNSAHHMHHHMSSNREEIKDDLTGADDVYSMLTVRDWTGAGGVVEDKKVKDTYVQNEGKHPERKASPANKPMISSEKKKATHLERDNSPVEFKLSGSNNKMDDNSSQPQQSSSFSFGMRAGKGGPIAGTVDPCPGKDQLEGRAALDCIDSADSVQQPNPFASMLNHLRNAGGAACPSPGLQPGQPGLCQTAAALVQTDSPKSPENQTPLRLLPEGCQISKETNNRGAKTPEVGDGDVEVWIERRGMRDVLNSPATADIRRMWSAVAECTRAQDEAARAATENDHLRQELQSVRDSMSRLFPNAESSEALLTAADGHEWARAEVSRAREAAEYMMALADQIQATFSLCEQEKASLAEELEAAWASAQKSSMESEHKHQLGEPLIMQEERSELDNPVEAASHPECSPLNEDEGGFTTTSMDLTVYNHHLEGLLESKTENEVVMREQLVVLQEDTRRLQAANDELRAMVMNIQDRLQTLEHKSEEEEKGKEKGKGKGEKQPGYDKNVPHDSTLPENNGQVVESIDFARLREAVVRAKGLVAASLTSSPDEEGKGTDPEGNEEREFDQEGDRAEEGGSQTCNAVIDGVLFTNVPRGKAGLSQVKELVQYFETLHGPATDDKETNDVLDREQCQGEDEGEDEDENGAEGARNHDACVTGEQQDLAADVTEQPLVQSMPEGSRMTLVPTISAEGVTPPQFHKKLSSLNDTTSNCPLSGSNSSTTRRPARTPAPTPVDGIISTAQRHHMNELELMGLLGREIHQDTPASSQTGDSTMDLSALFSYQEESYDILDPTNLDVSHDLEYNGGLGEQVHARLHRLKNELQAARMKLSRVDRGLLAITSPNTRVQSIEAGGQARPGSIEPPPHQGGAAGIQAADARDQETAIFQALEPVQAVNHPTSVKIKVEEKEEEIGVVGPLLDPLSLNSAEEGLSYGVDDGLEQRLQSAPLSLEYYHSTRYDQKQESKEQSQPKEEDVGEAYGAAVMASPGQTTRLNEFLFESSDEEEEDSEEGDGYGDENKYRSPSSSRIAMRRYSVNTEKTPGKRTPVHGRTATVIASTANTRATPQSQESYGNVGAVGRNHSLHSVRGYRGSRRPTDREEQEFRRRAAALKIHVSPYFKRHGSRSNEGQSQRDIMDTVR